MGRESQLGTQGKKKSVKRWENSSLESKNSSINNEQAPEFCLLASTLAREWPSSEQRANAGEVFKRLLEK